MISTKRSKAKLGFFQRPLFGVIYWKKIDITDGLSLTSEEYGAAKAAADEHEKPALPAFEFTEANPKWVLVYNLARKGQITPRVMKNMRRADLHFLAGHVYPHPALTQSLPDRDGKLGFAHVWVDQSIRQGWDEVTKLQGNAARAQAELDRRNFVWSAAFTFLAALAASGRTLAEFDNNCKTLLISAYDGLS
jgi:hypothetical protein